MNSSSQITFEKCINQLKEMFPDLDDEIIISALIENQNMFEKTVECLIDLNSATFKEVNGNNYIVNNVEEKEKEISLFSKNFQNNLYLNNNNNAINRNQNISENKNTQTKNKNINLNKNISENKKDEIFMYNNNENKVIKENLKPAEQNKNSDKKSFGQKFKNFMNNLFTKKNKDTKKFEEYKTIGQNEE